MVWYFLKMIDSMWTGTGRLTTAVIGVVQAMQSGSHGYELTCAG